MVDIMGFNTSTTHTHKKKYFKKLLLLCTTSPIYTFLKRERNLMLQNIIVFFQNTSTRFNRQLSTDTRQKTLKGKLQYSFRLHS